ncbi:MAG: leucine dehydrogenase [Oscillospiraceae bacterium]|nr:leucine dehydrogenase [Oscillospiraceae bacterium]
MQVLKSMSEYGHEQIVFAQDKSLGLRAIIAIHSTALGPALGGTRFFNYATDDDALFDVLRLSRGMTFKNAAAGLKLGGGKAVIIGDPKALKSREFFHAYAGFINSLGGKYYTAEDVNIGAADVALMNEVTKFVTGTPEVSGNPSPFTARGVFLGIKAGAKVRFGADSLKGKVIAVQGLGSVGSRLCGHLHGDGARLKVSDIDKEAVDRMVSMYGAEPLGSDEVITAECDILSPCAMGAVIRPENVGKLRCSMVAGAANNIVLDAATGDELSSRGILYLPDYIINAGGVLNCGMEIVEGRYSEDSVNAQVDKIYDTALKIVAYAGEKGISTYRAADEYAEGIVRAGAK